MKILIFIVLLAMCVELSNCICTINNPRCSCICKNRNCEYKPQENSFYSSDSNGINQGPKCCEGFISNSYILHDDPQQCTNTCVDDRLGHRTYVLLENATCVRSCPDGLFGQNYTQTCKQQCPITSYAHLQVSICVSQCYGKYMFADTIDNVCRENCSEKTQHTGLFFYGDLDLNLCVFVCQSGKFGDNKTGLCVQKCPSNTFGHNDSKMCVQVCPEDQFMNDALRLCVKECVFPMYAQNSTKTCVNKSSGGSAINYCDEGQCLPQQFCDNSTNTCIQLCPLGQFYDHYYYYHHHYLTLGNHSHQYNGQCNFNCSGGQFQSNLTRTCVSECPSKTYLDQQISACVEICDKGSALNKSTNTCYKLEKSKVNDSVLMTMIIVWISFSVTFFFIFTVCIAYKYFFKKRLVRKPLKYDMVTDIEYHV